MNDAPTVKLDSQSYLGSGSSITEYLPLVGMGTLRVIAGGGATG
jgi:hypothetical protein